MLTEGKPVRSSMDKDTIDYYEFIVLDEEIEEIVVEATVWNDA
jgi:hypothetical protein